MLEIKKTTVYSFILTVLNQPFKFDMPGETQEAAMKDLTEKLGIIVKELQDACNSFKPKSN